LVRVEKATPTSTSTSTSTSSSTSSSTSAIEYEYQEAECPQGKFSSMDSGGACQEVVYSSRGVSSNR
jgi:hypothetical protein